MDVSAMLVRQEENGKPGGQCYLLLRKTTHSEGLKATKSI